MLSLTIDYDEVRLLATDAAQNNFFRGLVSTRLGSDRILDDELVDLIATNQLLGEIFDEFCHTEAGRAKIKKAMTEIFPELPPPREGRDYEPVESDVCRLVWMQTVDDPRFDIVIKQALDDSKLPPPVVRGSGLSRITGLLDKIRAALTSGTTRHTDGVLAASIIAALLAGGAGGHYATQVLNNVSVPAVKLSNDTITPALDAIAKELSKQNLNDQRMSELESRITQKDQTVSNLRQDFNTQYADLSKRIASPSSGQIQQVQSSLTNLTNSLTKTNENLNLTNNNVKQLRDQMSLAEQVKESLQQIADGIGPPKEKDSSLPSLRASSQQIAVDLAPADDTSKDSTKDSHSATASLKPAPAGTSSSKITPAGSTIAASLKALESDAKTTEKTYLGIQPVAFFGEFSISMTQSNAPLRRVDGQSCQVTWTLISASTQSAEIALNSNNCQIGLPNNARIVLDHTRKRLPGTNLELSFERPDQTRFWPLSPKGAVIAVYQNPLLPQ
jgi:hypothetical protein